MLPFLGTARDLLSVRATCTSLSDKVDSDFSLWAPVTFPLAAKDVSPVADRAFKHHALTAACTNNPTALYSLMAHEWRGLCKLVNGSALAGPDGADSLLADDPSQVFSSQVATIVAMAAQALSPPSPDNQSKWSFLGCLHETMLAKLWTCLVLIACVRSGRAVILPAPNRLVCTRSSAEHALPVQVSELGQFEDASDVHDDAT